MSNKIRWGILGCGKIAAKFAADLRLVKDAELYAVASRDEAKGKEFSNVFGVSQVFTTYEALIASAVDVIYVATPHGLHHEHTLLCLKNNKPVLCEKALALNHHQVKEMIDVAQKNGVFLMEAFWSKFLPQYRKVIELIESGVIGKISWLQADFGFAATDPPAQRLYDPLLGGGSLLDVGIYPVFLAQSLLGKPEHIAATMIPSSSGVDEQCSMILKHRDGVLASLSCSFVADTPVEAVIAGTLGRIELRNRFHNASARVFLAIGKEDPKEIDVYREDGYGYQFEAQHVTDCLLKRLTESPVMTHQDSLDLMETLDAIRKVCCIRYPADA